jgi:hypothetical protein
VRISQTVDPWLTHLEREHDRTKSRRDYETGVIEGRHPEHVTLSPLSLTNAKACSTSPST